MPEAARQSMKRKDDPSGRSLPFGYTIHNATSLHSQTSKNSTCHIANR
jgi:hypothetical protein